VTTRFPSTPADTDSSVFRVGAALVDAIATRDPAIGEWFEATARLRALIPTGPVEVVGPDAVAATFAEWFGSFESVSLMGSASGSVADRLWLSYRLRLTQPGEEWLCGQEAFCKVSDGRIATMDIVCSGFRTPSRPAT
jgi:hypothetical protein